MWQPLSPHIPWEELITNEETLGAGLKPGRLAPGLCSKSGSLVLREALDPRWKHPGPSSCAGPLLALG